MIRPRTSRPRATVSLLTLSLRAAVGGFTLLVACGSRGPLDDDGPVVSTLDSGALPADAADAGELPSDAATPEDGAGHDGGGPDGGKTDGGHDAGAEGGTIVDCGSCLVGSCGTQILACVQSPSCRTTLQCVASTCLSGGTPNLGCVLGCAAGDLAGALQIFQVFQCATGTCGSDCGAVLGSLLGGAAGP
ncbi:MAG: hypothetical protein JWP97_4505 [Labilithrix sp.]|nr:hypothetical protein [Labilithrix sp.]